VFIRPLSYKAMGQEVIFLEHVKGDSRKSGRPYDIIKISVDGEACTVDNNLDDDSRETLRKLDRGDKVQIQFEIYPRFGQVGVRALHIS